MKNFIFNEKMKGRKKIGVFLAKIRSANKFFYFFEKIFIKKKKIPKFRKLTKTENARGSIFGI